MPTKNRHNVKPKDQKRIKCDVCDAPAKVCLHSHWKVGSQAGVSFWYRCTEHDEA